MAIAEMTLEVKKFGTSYGLTVTELVRTLDLVEGDSLVVVVNKIIRTPKIILLF